MWGRLMKQMCTLIGSLILLRGWQFKKKKKKKSWFWNPNCSRLVHQGEVVRRGNVWAPHTCRSELIRRCSSNQDGLLHLGKGSEQSQISGVLTRVTYYYWLLNEVQSDTSAAVIRIDWGGAQTAGLRQLEGLKSSTLWKTVIFIIISK